MAMSEERRQQLIEQFEEFFWNNPNVYRLFCHFAFDRISKGFKNYSADAVMHQVRWETAVVTKSKDDFKICNNHVSFYSRVFMEDYPEHEGFFRIKFSAATGYKGPL